MSVTKGVVVGAIAGAALFLSGCGDAAEQAAEEVAEQAIEEQGGGDVEIDADGESFSVEGEDGSEFSVGSDELPEDFPSDVPIPEGGTVESSSSMKTEGKAGWFVALSYADSDASELADQAANGMKDSGFKETSTFSADESTTTAFEGNGYQVTVSVAPDAEGGGSSLTLTVAEL